MAVAFELVDAAAPRLARTVRLAGFVVDNNDDDDDDDDEEEDEDDVADAAPVPLRVLREDMPPNLIPELKNFSEKPYATKRTERIIDQNGGAPRRSCFECCRAVFFYLRRFNY